ncbi:MAG: hypothetical protein D6758_02505 [Gammaproteobacteria bacterium]|nr:MAG: hypothetical protein D6758_02505 [Gammaproteobacteria bacterium]
MKKGMWLAWIVLTLLVGGAVGWQMFRPGEVLRMSPGPVLPGHQAFGQVCESCHTGAFEGDEAIQAACENCHGDALRAAQDSHPAKVFRDPRNADRLAVLDATQCQSCHREHQPEQVHPMGLTLPEDYCVACHADIADERPSHENLTFDSCATSGCHNYHDNRALYETFLLKHIGEPVMRTEWRLPASTLTGKHPGLDSNCANCHASDRADMPGWITLPPDQACGACHQFQRNGFQSSRHGVRTKWGIDNQVARILGARTKTTGIRSDALAREQGCTTCHRLHEPGPVTVQTCRACHDGPHSRAFETSPHATLTRGEQPFSCATCHFPKARTARGRVQTHHNASANLRPNEKMVRTVCLDCHGLGFTLDALAQPELIRTNFTGLPTDHIPSLDWVAVREKASGPKTPPQAEDQP